MGPSSKLALLSFGLSVWLSGSAQLRNALLVPEAQAQSTRRRVSTEEWNWKDWMARKGKSLDQSEKSLIAAVDLATAFSIFQFLQIKPILPFLLTPLLATIPLPQRRLLKRVSWLRVLMAISLFTLLHESEKITFLQLLKIWRRYEILKKGRIVARGMRSIPGSNDGEEECLICSGVGIDAASSKETTLQQPTSLGPLEEFCSIAPSKHVAHRECFLRWVDTRVFVEPVLVRPESNPQLLHSWSKAERAKIESTLRSAGFENVIPHLVFENPLPMEDTTGSTVLSVSNFQPSTSSANPPAFEKIATLHTTSPSCPACRSAVKINFVCERPSAGPPTSAGKIMGLIKPQDWFDDWSSVVTGRTLISRLSTHYTFLFVLVSMIKTRRLNGSFIYV